MKEARLEEKPSGLAPASDGWFVVNVRDAAWRTDDTFGSTCTFESKEAPFPEMGIRIRVLAPGTPNCMYHAENAQEDFLVLSGECRLLVEGQERTLKAWDFVHCPPDTEHVFVGSGTRPCVILMAGVRKGDAERIVYPLSELAQRYGAGVEARTESPEEAYAKFAESRMERPANDSALPWNRA